MSRSWMAGIVLLFLGCATQAPPVPVLEKSGGGTSRSAGYVLEPGAGEPLIFCDTPDLRVNIKVSPATTGDAPLALGTAELTGSNSGTHPDEDEVIYFLSGSGSAFVGETTVRIRHGVTMYVPRGVRHGFTSEGSEPVRFLWAIAPTGLEEKFRAGGLPPSVGCAAAPTGERR